MAETKQEQQQQSHALVRKLDTHLPSSVVARFYGAFNGQISLNDSEQISAFKRLRDKLSESCSSESNNLTNLPAVIECWNRSFKADEISSKLFIFDHVPSIRQFKTDYQANKYRKHPFVGEIISKLAQLEELGDGASQNVAKILLSYIADVAMQLCFLDITKNANTVARIVSHIYEVMKTAHDDISLRVLFENRTHEGFKQIYLETYEYLEKSQSIIETQKIPAAFSVFAEAMFQVLAQYTQFLLILTEGGNRKDLPISNSGIASFKFSKNNPLSGLIVKAAKFIPTLQTSSVTVLPMGACVPELEDVRSYVNQSAGKTRIGPFNHAPVAHFLLQKTDPKNDALTVWAKSSDTDVIQSASERIVRSAQTHEFLTFVTQFAFNLSTMCTLNGQNLNSSEAQFLLKVMTTLKGYLTLIKNEMLKVSGIFTKNAETSRRAYEHHIFTLLSDIDNQINHIFEHAFKPLENLHEILAKNKSTRKQVVGQVIASMQSILDSRAFFQTGGNDLPPIIPSTRHLNIPLIQGAERIIMDALVPRTDEDDRNNTSNHLFIADVPKKDKTPNTSFVQPSFINPPSVLTTQQEPPLANQKTLFPSLQGFNFNSAISNSDKEKILISAAIGLIVFLIVTAVLSFGGVVALPTLSIFLYAGGGALFAFCTSLIGFECFKDKPEPDAAPKKIQNPFSAIIEGPNEPKPTAAQKNDAAEEQLVESLLLGVSQLDTDAATAAPAPAIDVHAPESKAVVISRIMTMLKAKDKNKLLPVKEWCTSEKLNEFIKRWAQALAQDTQMPFKLSVAELEKCVLAAVCDAIGKNLIEVNPKEKAKIIENIKQTPWYEEPRPLVSNNSMFSRPSITPAAKPSTAPAVDLDELFGMKKPEVSNNSMSSRPPAASSKPSAAPANASSSFDFCL